MDQVASILLTDRYIFFTHGLSEDRLDKVFLKFNYKTASKLDYENPSDKDTVILSFKRGLAIIEEQCPSLKALTIGSCVAIISSATFDRDIDAPYLSPYGVIGESGTHPEWEGINLYEIASNFFPHIRENIFVRADVSLAALGEFHYRLNSRTKHLAPLSHYNKLNNVPVDERHITLAYLKLSADINGAFVYDGHLLGGMNHPYLFGVKPRRMTFNGKIDDFGGCKYHGACYSGLVSSTALQARLDRLGVETLLFKLPEDDPIWDILVYYITQLCLSVMAMHVPTSIVLGGRLVSDYSRKNWPKNNIVRRIAASVESEIAKGPTQFPFIEKGYNFIKEAACKTPVAYGGLYLAAKKMYSDDDPARELNG